jgi:predicted nucleotidyltransferase
MTACVREHRTVFRHGGVCVADEEGAGTDCEFGLRPEELELIREIFRRHPEVLQVKVFGSRATGHFEESSDIDLALWGDLTPALLGRILRELDELPLPYTFDVEAYATIRHPLLKRHIDEAGKTLYEHESLSALH